MIFKLWLTWKNSKGKSFAIGELTYEEEKNEYIFKYINSELNSARENGFDFFPGFDDMEKDYVSNTGLFPNIETRLPNTSRPEYLEILNSYDLEINSSQMEILERTKGRLLTDNFEFVPAFDRSKNKIEFEVAGTAYFDDIKENKDIFEINDKLLLERETDNEYDEYAISVICTKNGKNYKLGYVPRYYSKELSKLLNENVKYSAQIKYLNFKSELNDEDITADVKLIIESK